MKRKMERILYVVLLVLVTTCCILCLKQSIGFAETKKLEIEESSKVDYLVYLKENDYFDEKYLPAGKQYIASLIDYIDTRFVYTFDTDKAIDYDYSYDIIGTLIAHEKGDESRVLYEKDYTLKDTTRKSVEDVNSFTINDSVKINYDYYNQIISSFKGEYSLSLDSYLRIKLIVRVTAKYDEFENPVMKQETLEMKIPLTEQTIKVGMEYKDVNQITHAEEENHLEITNIVFFFFFWVSILLDIFITLAFVRSYEEEKKAKGHYLVELEKIQKHYDRAIVETTILPDIEGKQVVEVERFEELLDARENVEKPILHFKKNDYSVFLIVDANIVYKFILK